MKLPKPNIATKFICFVLLNVWFTQLKVHGTGDSIQWMNKDLSVIKLSDKVYIIKSYAFVPSFGRVDANGLLIECENSLVLVNTPWNDTLTNILLDWTEVKFHKPIQKVIITHSHDDCAGGLNTITQRGIASITLDKTRKLQQEQGLPLTSTTFSDSIQLKPALDLLSEHANQH